MPDAHPKLVDVLQQESRKHQYHKERRFPLGVRFHSTSLLLWFPARRSHPRGGFGSSPSLLMPRLQIAEREAEHCLHRRRR